MQNVQWKLCVCLHPGRRLRKGSMVRVLIPGGGGAAEPLVKQLGEAKALSDEKAALEPIACRPATGTNKLPERQINGSSYVAVT